MLGVHDKQAIHRFISHESLDLRTLAASIVARREQILKQLLTNYSEKILKIKRKIERASVIDPANLPVYSYAAYFLLLSGCLQHCGS